MARKNNEYKEGLKVLIQAQQMTDEVYRLQTKTITVIGENCKKTKRELMPKRSRWEYGTRILEKCDQLLDLITYANDLPMDIPELFKERVKAVYKSRAVAKTIARSINDQQRRLQLSADHFENWARLYNVFYDTLYGWIRMHDKIYKNQ